MPKISQSEIRKKDFYVAKDIKNDDVKRVIVPNGVQLGVPGFEPDSVPLKLTANQLKASTESGGIEYDGVDLFYTPDGLSRRNITARPYASFLNTASQTATTATVVELEFNETAYASYVELLSNTQIYPGYSGMYNIMYSMQLKNTDGSEQEAFVWFRKNDVDLPNTKSIITIPKQRGVGSPGYAILAMNVFEYIEVGSHIELVWLASSNLVSIDTVAATTSPPDAYTSPVSPAVILTLHKVD